MRDAATQRMNTMIPDIALRKPFKPHVSHAESEGYPGVIPEAAARSFKMASAALC